MKKRIEIEIRHVNFLINPAKIWLDGFTAPVHHDPLGQVHRVGDGDDDEPGRLPAGPLEDVVQDRLLPVPQHVQLVDEEDCGHPPRGRPAEPLVEQVGGLFGSHLEVQKKDGYTRGG